MRDMNFPRGPSPFSRLSGVYGLLFLQGLLDSGSILTFRPAAARGGDGRRVRAGVMTACRSGRLALLTVSRTMRRHDWAQRTKRKSLRL